MTTTNVPLPGAFNASDTNGVLTDKEFNSSTDTYTSDTAEMKPEEPFERMSFDRNFDINEDVEKTIERTVNIENEEFSFIQVQPTEPKASPNKSALKKTPSNSPKKNVVFTTTVPQVIHYLQPDASMTEEDEDSKFSQQVEQTLNHQWGEVKDNSDSSDDNTPPPIPPPHTIGLKELKYNDNVEDLDKAALSSLKLNLSNQDLPLNEKLDLFLNKQKQGQSKELDQHLQDLNDASKYQVETNIHNLSLDLQNKHGNKVENPLDSLSKSTDVPLKSAGSSQSSLQSLMESNRVLQSHMTQDNGSNGIQLNDGIHGFSNDLVEKLIPQSQSNNNFTNSDDSQMFTINPKRFSVRSMVSDDNEEFHDSFDNEYNNTEQSIMNLLTSASAHASKEQVNVKNEATEDNPFLEEFPTSDLKIKLEMGDIVKPELKPDLSDDDYDASFESDRKFNIGDHIDNGWKFDDSQDGDREDNDEITNNDLTIVSEHQDLDAESDIEDLDKKIAPQQIESEDHTQGLGKDLDIKDLDAKNLDIRDLDTKEPEVDEKDTSSASESPAALEPLEVISPNTSASIEESPDRVTLAPPRSTPASPIKLLSGKKIDIAVDATNPPTPIRLAREQKLRQQFSVSPEASPTPKYTTLPTINHGVESKRESRESSEEPIEKSIVNPEKIIEDEDIVKKESYDESEVLANSTNVAPPDDMTLPPIEHSSFEEFTKTFNNSKDTEDSFEKALSAEFDEEKNTKPTSYLSIWHSQNRSKHKKPINFSSKPIDSSNISIYDPSTNTFKIPRSMMNKRFTDVNVVSRKTIDPENETVDSLPELSHDSGLEKHFNTLVNNNDSSMNTSNNRLSATPLSTKNILNNLNQNKSDEDFLAVPSHVIGSITVGGASQPSLSPQILPKKPINEQRRSKFKVPSFEIKKSIEANSIGVRDQYNDIFDDTVHKDEPLVAPTIKGFGMKTLPSMDKDDVKKILNTKRIISQDEYSQLKLVGRKSSVVHDDAGVNTLPQTASIHHADNLMDSSPIMDQLNVQANDEPIETGIVIPHLANELMKDPTALRSRDQVFNDSDFFSSQGATSPALGDLESTIRHYESQNFPEPDPELINSPGRNIFKTPPKDYEEPKEVDEVVALKINDKENKPPKGKPGSPIKIGSPIKVAKRGSSVDFAASSHPHSEVSSQFAGNELVNQKLRNGVQGDQEHAKEQKPSVVSVPSIYTDNTNITEPSGVSSQTLFNNNRATTTNSWKQHSVQSSVIREEDQPVALERGRLFFRVIGLKNISLPDIPAHKGEFHVTLDNGIHCIKTPSYNLDTNRAVIGKEFELTVGDSLEFILTMKMQYKKPKDKLVEVRERKVVKSKNKLTRMFGSKNVVTTTKFVPQDSDDSWKTKFAQDGSFGRCYVDLGQYEDKIKFQTTSFDIPVFNEWEVVNTSSGTMKAKPYVIAQLEVKMLYIPRSEMNEALPTSIKSANDILNQLLQEKEFKYEGCLTQDGGDCETMKRRFFKLEGTSLIAHSEFSRKTRAKINLAKIIDVIYIDNQNPETTKKARNFSDVLLMPDAFKIKFANGEIIDFTAQNLYEKAKWISMFESIAQHNRYRRLPWVKSMVGDAPVKSNNPWFNESV